MNDFLSEESILMHREYLRELRLKYSILEKSIKGLKGKNIREIMRQNFQPDVKKEAITLLSEVELHELFFASFSETGGHSKRVAMCYGSVGAFLNLLYSLALDADGGFLVIHAKRGKITPAITYVKEYYRLADKPVLALDLCEHCYFPDYRFNKNAYLLAALPRLDLSRLEEIC